ncbi:MAG: phenylalanyl-tRNA synthetase beta chain [bacterium]|jgi:phenylalanyl-tRNA synthetase beta chain
MKLSLNWIKDFVDVPELDPTEFVKKITLTVCEIEGFELTGTHLSSIKVAEVLEINVHPDAEKLSLVKITSGNEEHNLVCGASNFKVGDKVAFAGLGTVLPGNFKIKKAKIRGVESLGMLCAGDELGLSEDHDGLLLLPSDSEVGQTLDQLYPDQMDLVFEVDNKSITHRPDLWGHYGFAREVSAAFKLPLKPYERDMSNFTVVEGKEITPDYEHGRSFSHFRGEGENLINVEVLAGELVPRFSGLSIKDVAVVESPAWIQHRLFRVGLRAINNMVDITNYVMMELGQPMHAFDAEEIEGGKLTVQMAKNGDKVMTLYQKEAKLTENDLTICDANGASVVAGIIGGLNSGVTDKTTSIFFEAGNWNPVTVRKTSTRIGIRTDACTRYEKSLAPEMTVLAIIRATALLKLTAPNLTVCGELIDIWGKDSENITIELSHSFVVARLGADISKDETQAILERLGFILTAKDDDLFTVQVPTWRATKDIMIPEDLVEEVGRVYGFSNIKPEAPLFPIERPVFNVQRAFERQAKSTLSYNGFHEVYNYPLTDQATEQAYVSEHIKVMTLLNPVAENQNQMRTTLLPHLVSTILENQKDEPEFKLYEIGRVYEKQGEEVKEENRLILGLSKTSGELGDAFYELKHDLNNVLSQLQVSDVSWKATEEEERRKFQHPYISAEIFSGKEKIGEIFSFAPMFRDQVSLKHDVCIAELDFEKMFAIEHQEYQFQELHKFPPVLFDISLLIPKKSYFQEVKDVILASSKSVVQVNFFDLYYPKEAPEQKSMSVSIVFRSKEKTLGSEEIKNLQDKVIAKLAKAGFNLR